MIYCMIDKDGTYDYENEQETTENVLTALEWIANGCCEQVAKLDGCSLAYLGYLDADDVIDCVDEIDFDDCISEIRFMLSQGCITDLYDLIDSYHYKAPYDSFMSFYATKLYKDVIKKVR